MISDFLLPIISFLLTPFKKTGKKIQSWIGSLRRLRFLHTAEEINQYIANFDFKHFEKTARLDGTILSSRYNDDMHEMTIEDRNGIRIIKIPYMEVINFIKCPETEIKIICSVNDPLLLDKEFKLPLDLERATDICVKDVLKENEKTTNDWHTRLASLECKSSNRYICYLEKTKYYQQIRTNLSMDRYIEYKGRRTTIRTLEQERQQNNSSLQFPKCLNSLEESLLANVIGVSAIWCLGDLADPKFYLMPRNNKVGTYKNKLGMPSGDIECPQKNNFRFRNSSLIEYLKWEIAREFAEETGIADKNKEISQYSIEIDKRKIKYRTEMEIIPLALVREMLRGGKPQMFFLIRTENISEKQLRKYFKSSLGITEFKNTLLTTASLSSEVICNYLYAQDYLQKNKNGIIDIR